MQARERVYSRHTETSGRWGKHGRENDRGVCETDSDTRPTRALRKHQREKEDEKRQTKCERKHIKAEMTAWKAPISVYLYSAGLLGSDAAREVQFNDTLGKGMETKEEDSGKHRRGMWTNRNGNEKKEMWDREKCQGRSWVYNFCKEKSYPETPGLIFLYNVQFGFKTHCKAPKIHCHLILFPADLNAYNEHLMYTPTTQFQL